ncbi:MAG: molybdopterin-guanine dinucleotide biosynthesis protein B [Coriobacteriales bacterium]|jgi:molybdopterin-guanine dinucleotide biosynthesis protein MobB|nr:molybdopterin-guanine dinucleotide biosynthesis protein B [Coriobacteriales bacterium]
MTPSINSIPAVAFVGKQNSGKTTLLEKLIAALSDRGVRVATVKHHSHAGFDFDIEGKDSWRHRQAGSAHTVIAAPDQIASVRTLTREVELREIIDMMTHDATIIGDAPSLILVEGYRHAGIPTIELFRAGNPADEARDLGGEGNQIVGVVTDILRIKEQAKSQDLPTFPFNNPAPLADFLTERFINS